MEETTTTPVAGEEEQQQQEQQQQQEDNLSGVFVKTPKGVEADEEAIRSALASFGEIQRVNMRESGAQVFFTESPEPASKALEAGKVAVGEAELELAPLRTKSARLPRRRGGAKKGGAANGKQASGEAGSEAAAQPDPRAVYARVTEGEPTEESVKAVFAKYGEVERVKLSTRKNRSGTSATHIFVTYADVAGADAVLAAADNKEGEEVKLGDEVLAVERRKRSPKTRAPKQAAAGGAEAGGDAEAANAEAGDKAAKKKTKKRKPAKKADGAAAPAEAAPGDGEEGAQAPAAKGERRAPAPKTSVYITNMVVSTTEDALKKAFEKFGTIKSASCQQRESFATVAFADAAAAEAALAASKEGGKLELAAEDGSTKSLTVSPWRAAGRSGRTTDPVENAVHVMGLGFAVPSQDEVRKVFAPLGEVVSVKVHPTRSFGIVRFEDADAAARVVQEDVSELGLAPEDPEVPLVVELSDSARSGRHGRGGNGRRRQERRRTGRRGGGVAKAAESGAAPEASQAREE